MEPLRRTLLAAVALLLTSFAGCVLPFEEGNVGINRIVKKAVLTINEDSDGDRLEDFLSTSFEYTHDGAPVHASNLTAEYLGADGQARSRALSSFTSRATLEPGTVVVIPAVNFTSGLLIKQGDQLVAGRGGINAQWFRAADIPVPLASSKAGEVRYALESLTGFEASGANFDADEEVHINSVMAKLDVNADGDLKLITTRPAEGPRLEALLHLVPTVEAEASASITDSEGTYEAGVDTRDMRGTFDARAVLQFDGANNLRRGGASFDGFFDGRVHVWDREHPKSANYEPEDIEHPMFDEEEPYREETFDESGDDVPAWVVQFLTRLWSMEIGVGDDYRVHVDIEFFTGRIQFDLVLQVAAKEPRAAGGQIHPTYRVTQVANLILSSGAKTSTFDISHTTFWISTNSYLPVYAQSSSSKTFSRSDIEEFLKMWGEDAPVSLPASASLILKGEQTLQMSSYQGDLAVAPIIGLMINNPSQLGFMPLGAAFAFMMVSDIGSQTAQNAPNIVFAQDETGDGIMVTSAAAGANWNRYEVRSSHDGYFRFDPDGSSNDRGSVRLPAGLYVTVTASDVPVKPSDRLCFWTDAGNANVKIDMRDAVASGALGQGWFFSTTKSTAKTSC